MYQKTKVSGAKKVEFSREKKSNMSNSAEDGESELVCYPPKNIIFTAGRIIKSRWCIVGTLLIHLYTNIDVLIVLL